jgi:hypothetical protein
MLLDGKFEKANHKYTLQVAHEGGGEGADAPDDRGFIMKHLTTRVVVTYANRLGDPWGFTATYDIGGLTLGASIGAGYTVGGLFGELGSKVLKDVTTAFGIGNLLGGKAFGLGQAAGTLGKDASNVGEKGKEAVDESKPVEGGLSVGLMKIEVGEAEADGVGQYWGPADLEGPVMTVAFCKFEGAIGAGAGGSYNYTGIDGLEFAGAGMPTRMTFAKIGKSEPKIEASAGAKVEFTPVEGGVGYAKLTG